MSQSVAKPNVTAHSFWPDQDQLKLTQNGLLHSEQKRLGFGPVTSCHDAKPFFSTHESPSTHQSLASRTVYDAPGTCRNSGIPPIARTCFASESSFRASWQFRTTHKLGTADIYVPQRIFDGEAIWETNLSCGLLPKEQLERTLFM